MTRFTNSLAAVCAIVYLGGCAALPYEPYAREVKRKAQVGGVIALHATHRDEDRAKADLLMKGNCGGLAPKINEEGEVVVGETVSSTAKKTQDSAENSAFSLGGIRFGSTTPAENTATQSTTTQIKEWQISYDCVADNTAPAAPTAKASKHGKKKKG